MKINNAIIEASKFLKLNKIKSPLLDSEILLSQVLNKEREYVIINSEQNLAKKNYDQFINLVRLRSSGKPISYLTKKKNFWKNEFYIYDGALIPRPDTEIIIEETLKIFKNKSKLMVLDIGIGSGCILLSLLDEKKDFYGVGVDISQKCIDISRINTKKLGLENRVKLFKSDVDNFRYGKYDLIISNPPYINKYDLKYLERDVIHFEPMQALDGGFDGLSEIRKTINKSSELIKTNGKLVLEIAFDQKEKVKRLLKIKGFFINKVLKDYAKNDRCIICTKI